MTANPFRQLPFAQVPEDPIVRHRWWETRREDVVIETADLPRTRICVREFGPPDAPPLVLLHGLMTAGYSWRYVLEALGAKHRLVIPDLPGAGFSESPDVPLGPEVLARAVLAILAATGTRGAPMIGNSMGGYIAMRAAMIDPTAISRLVNEHSPGVPTARMTALWWALRVLPSRMIIDRLVARDPEHWVHRNVHYYDESLKSREEHREYASPLSTREGRRGFYRHMREGLDVRAMKRFVRDLKAAPFPIPLLLVYARRDPVVPPIVGERLHALVPASKLVWLEEGSHFAHVDAPAQFVAAVEPFLG